MDFPFEFPDNSPQQTNTIEQSQSFQTFYKTLQFPQYASLSYKTPTDQFKLSWLSPSHQKENLNLNSKSTGNKNKFQNQLQNIQNQKEKFLKNQNKGKHGEQFDNIIKQRNLEKTNNKNSYDISNIYQSYKQKQFNIQNRISLLQNIFKSVEPTNLKNQQIPNNHQLDSPQISSIILPQNLQYLSNISVSQSKQFQILDVYKKNRRSLIQDPDQAYLQLQQDKHNKIQKQQKIRKKITDKINNTKIILEQISIKKSQSKQLKQIQLKIQNTYLNLNATLISSTLFRFPISQNKFSFVCLTGKDDSFYHKHSYQLTSQQLIIHYVCTVPIVDIIKIKIIHNQYNRPQLKINYKLSQPKHQMRSTKQSQQKNQRKFNKNKDLNESESIIFICDCYQAIYSIYSWILVRKIKIYNNGKQLQLNRAQKISIKDGLSFNYEVSGIFLKQSKFLKIWEKFYGRISNFSLKSYNIILQSSHNLNKEIMKSNNSNNIPSYKIEKDSNFEINNLKQLWTRFQILDKKYLVLKMFKKNKIQKFQIAVPIGNFCDCENKGNWMFGMIGLLKGEN